VPSNFSTKQKLSSEGTWYVFQPNLRYGMSGARDMQELAGALIAAGHTVRCAHIHPSLATSVSADPVVIRRVNMSAVEVVRTVDSRFCGSSLSLQLGCPPNSIFDWLYCMIRWRLCLKMDSDLMTHLSQPNIRLNLSHSRIITIYLLLKYAFSDVLTVNAKFIQSFV
jgi:hypothetical protein